MGMLVDFSKTLLKEAYGIDVPDYLLDVSRDNIIDSYNRIKKKYLKDKITDEGRFRTAEDFTKHTVINSAMILCFKNSTGATKPMTDDEFMQLVSVAVKASGASALAWSEKTEKETMNLVRRVIKQMNEQPDLPSH